MGHDKRFSRFFNYLSLFAASMLGLIIANNMLLLFICWELVGVCSYFLIGFWFEKESAANAAKKAFITTKIGDLGIFIALMLILWSTGHYGTNMTFNFFSHEGKTGFFDLLSVIPTWVLTLVALFLFIGAMGKSAQFPLHVWLPDAMEGPTSVSALIHAATMVAAGVYLVGRAYPIFAAAVIPLVVVAFIGAFTAVFAASIAVTANDIKRVLAYSTLSQLGYMMLGLGVGGYTAGMFHLLTHAFFKALLFLGAGSVIHGMSGKQDIWEMGGLWKPMKWTCITFGIGTLALIGFPGTSGFFSKDEILASAYTFGGLNHGRLPFISYIPFVFGMIGVFLTAFYMTRCFTLTFLGNRIRSGVHAHESGSWMVRPLIVLSIFALLAGFLGMPEGIAKIFGTSNMFHHFVHFQWENAVKVQSIFNYDLAKPETPSEIPMILSILLGFGGIFCGYVIYGFRIFELPLFKPLYRQTFYKLLSVPYKGVYLLIKNKYFVDEIYRYLIIDVMLLIGKVCFIIDQYIVDKFVDFWAYFMIAISKTKRWFDDNIVDGIAVNGWGYISVFAGKKLTYLQNGYVQRYIMFICIGIIFLTILGVVVKF
jgi:NADH-quinone oxidoreductase subunit L